ncbi:hypothetical protein D3C85_1768860 [compost metagenome]
MAPRQGQQTVGDSPHDPTILPLILALLPTALWEQETAPAGVGFSHHDWELACDNTRVY